MNLADVLHASARGTRDRPAVTDVRDRPVADATRDLARETERVAAFLSRAGRGARPAHRAPRRPNGPAYLPAAFGLLAAGACLVPLAANLTPAGDRADPAARWTSTRCLSCARARRRCPARRRRVARRAARATASRSQWLDRERRRRRRISSASIPPSSASPRGRRRSARASCCPTRRRSRGSRPPTGVLRFTADDRILWVLPLAYHFAVTIVAYVRAGAHVLMCPDTLPARASSRRSGGSSASVLYASPLHFERLGNLEPTGRVRRACAWRCPPARRSRRAVMRAIRGGATACPSARRTGSSRRGCRASTSAPTACRPTSVGRAGAGVRGRGLRRGRRAGCRRGTPGRDRRARRRPLLRLLRAVAAARARSRATAGSSPATSARLDDVGALHLAGPQEGGHLRGRAQVLPGGSRGVHQPRSRASRSRACSARRTRASARCRARRSCSAPDGCDLDALRRTARARCRRTRCR